jgi:DNA-binding LacI/PurR family transcriptional regulator
MRATALQDPPTAESLGRRATMADVAKLAGVSHQTVSRVLNGHPSVSQQTHARVRLAIEQLGYRRNLAARTLVTKRSGVLGVISYDVMLYGPSSTLHGIRHSAGDAGYFVSVASLEQLTRQTVGDAFDRLADQGIDGIIVIAPLGEALDALGAVTGQLPLVVVAGGGSRGFPTVSVDQAAGARLVTRHLLDQGVETVWHVAGPTDWLDAEARVGGWLEELRTAGTGVPDPIRGDWRPASGYAAGQALCHQGDVGAVFVANDQMALGVLGAFHEAGVRVPEDTLVAGFDDVPEASYYIPPLTTVRQDFDTVGQRSIELLLGEIAGEPTGRRDVVVRPELVVRQSSVRTHRTGRHPRAHPTG